MTSLLDSLWQKYNNKTSTDEPGHYVTYSNKNRKASQQCCYSSTCRNSDMKSKQELRKECYSFDCRKRNSYPRTECRGDIVRINNTICENSDGIYPMEEAHDFVSRNATRSILVLPLGHHKALARQGGFKSKSTAVYGFSSTHRANYMWPYPANRPLYQTTWRYLLDTARSMQAVALSIRVLWANIRWIDIEEDNDGLRVLTEDKGSYNQGRVLKKHREYPPYGLVNEYFVLIIKQPKEEDDDDIPKSNRGKGGRGSRGGRVAGDRSYQNYGRYTKKDMETTNADVSTTPRLRDRRSLAKKVLDDQIGEEEEPVTEVQRSFKWMQESQFKLWEIVEYWRKKLAPKVDPVMRLQPEKLVPPPSNNVVDKTAQWVQSQNFTGAITPVPIKKDLVDRDVKWEGTTFHGTPAEANETFDVASTYSKRGGKDSTRGRGATPLARGTPARNYTFSAGKFVTEMQPLLSDRPPSNNNNNSGRGRGKRGNNYLDDKVAQYQREHSGMPSLTPSQTIRVDVDDPVSPPKLARIDIAQTPRTLLSGRQGMVAVRRVIDGKPVTYQVISRHNITPTVTQPPPRLEPNDAASRDRNSVGPRLEVYDASQKRMLIYPEEASEYDSAISSGLQNDVIDNNEIDVDEEDDETDDLDLFIKELERTSRNQLSHNRPDIGSTPPKSKEDMQRDRIVCKVMKELVNSVCSLEQAYKKEEVREIKDRERKMKVKASKMERQQRQHLDQLCTQHATRLRREISKRRGIMESEARQELEEALEAKKVRKELRRKRRRSKWLSKQQSSMGTTPTPPIPKKVGSSKRQQTSVQADLQEYKDEIQRLKGGGIPVQKKREFRTKSRKDSEIERPVKKSRMRQEKETPEEDNLHCICKTVYDPTKFYVGCDLCARWFHGKCVGVSEKHARKMDAWICSECEQEKNYSEQELYCVCKQSYDDTQFYVGCDGCEGWFHPRCVGTTQQEAENMQEFVCESCQLGGNLQVAQKMLDTMDYNRLWRVWSALYEHRVSWPFREPVDLQQHPTYTQIVFIPMDMQTIKGKLERCEYIRIAEFQVDIGRVFDNARLFNPRDSPIHQCACILEKRFVESMQKVKETMGRDLLNDCEDQTNEQPPIIQPEDLQQVHQFNQNHPLVYSEGIEQEMVVDEHNVIVVDDPHQLQALLQAHPDLQLQEGSNVFIENQEQQITQQIDVEDEVVKVEEESSTNLLVEHQKYEQTHH